MGSKLFDKPLITLSVFGETQQFKIAKVDVKEGLPKVVVN
jgi:hypothetical protein